jgi:flagellar assembly factor FliW
MRAIGRMMTCKTRFHGPITFSAQDVLAIPSGLFGFVDETEFLLLAVPSSRPIVFLQSIRSPKLCFISLPVQIVDANYALSLNCADLKRLGYSRAAPPRLSKDVLCLALLTIRDGSVTTANLVAPIVIDIRAHRGVQVLMKKQYSHRHPIPAAESRLAC